MAARKVWNHYETDNRIKGDAMSRPHSLIRQTVHGFNGQFSGIEGRRTPTQIHRQSAPPKTQNRGETPSTLLKYEILHCS